MAAAGVGPLHFFQYTLLQLLKSLLLLVSCSLQMLPQQEVDKTIPFPAIAAFRPAAAAAAAGFWP
jgi:hypothetical protein